MLSRTNTTMRAPPDDDNAVVKAVKASRTNTHNGVGYLKPLFCFLVVGAVHGTSFSAQQSTDPRATPVPTT